MAVYNAKKLTITKDGNTYIIDPMQGNEAVYVDLNVKIRPADWASGTGKYTYVFTDFHLTQNSAVFVRFKESMKDSDLQSISYLKETGKVTFSITEMVTDDVDLVVRVVDATTEGVYPIDASMIETDAVVGEMNVQGALEDLDERISQQEGSVKSVNHELPDEAGNVQINTVNYANNMTSDKTQNSEEEFIIRTSGGDASISDGDAYAIRIFGNSVHTGVVNEELDMALTLAPRVAPDPITAVLDEATFEAYVEVAGIYTLSYDGSDWDNDPIDYGVTVTGDPLSGDSISIEWDGENDATMFVDAPRSAPDPILATIDRDTFVAYVSVSGVTTLSYTSSWSADPTLYGVTVSGIPISGDTITITYIKGDRGTITVADPSILASTGWNLYNYNTGRAYLSKYSSEYGFYISGTYSLLQYSATITGEKTTITPVDHVFTIPDDGIVWVTGGNSVDTYIINQWSDWTDGVPEGTEFKTYSESVVDFGQVMATYFQNGLMRVDNIRDEINFNTAQAISKIERLAYSAENLAIAEASGRPYECDTNYIYLVKASYDTYSITVDGSYIASDHGNEFFPNTTVPVYLETMYGNNLKNKLERDVVTISQQTLTSAQQTQIRSNLNAASKTDLVSAVNSLNSKIETNETNLTGTTYLYKTNKIVQFELVGCSIASLISSGIPSGYRPKRSSRGIIMVRNTYASNPRITFLNINVDGSVTFYAAESYNSGDVSSVSQGMADGCMTWITE